MTQLTKSQKKKADKICAVIEQLKSEGVQMILLNSNIEFYRGEIPFGENPDYTRCYSPKTITVEDFNP